MLQQAPGALEFRVTPVTVLVKIFDVKLCNVDIQDFLLVKAKATYAAGIWSIRFWVTFTNMFLKQGIVVVDIRALFTFQRLQHNLMSFVKMYSELIVLGKEEVTVWAAVLALDLYSRRFMLMANVRL